MIGAEDIARAVDEIEVLGGHRAAIAQRAATTKPIGETSRIVAFSMNRD